MNMNNMLPRRLLLRAPIPRRRPAPAALVPPSFSTARRPPSTARRRRARRDWRELFRSSDYDDPWSAYRPLSPPVPSPPPPPSANARGEGGRSAVVASVLDGTWERRRHGLNLEPLRMLRRGAAAEDDAALTLGEDYRAGEEGRDAAEEDVGRRENDHGERHPWGEEGRRVARATDAARGRRRLRWIDAQTRFLCRMLDDLYRTGIRRETDRPRTERCHRAIYKLLSMTPKNPPRKHEAPPPEITFAGAAQRSGEILRRMEQCSPPILVGGKQSKLASAEKTEESGHRDDEVIHSDDDVATLSGNGFLSYQGVYTDCPPPHLSFTKFELPNPTREIYNMVLISYAKESGTGHIAEQAEDVVWSMIARATAQTKRTTERGRGGAEDDGRAAGDGIAPPDVLLPTRKNWNCVLDCWSRSTDPDRAYRAYAFLRAWMEWNGRGGGGKDLQEDARSTNVHPPDLDSLRLILHCSLAASEEFEDETGFNRARGVGSGIAVRLWKEQRTLDVSLDAAAYRMVFQAICQSSELPSPKGSRMLNYLARVFVQCRNEDAVTPEIMDLLRAVTTEKQFVRLTTT